MMAAMCSADGFPRTLMTSNSGVALKRFCVIYDGDVAIGETETGIAGADETVQIMSANDPDGRYRYDEPTRLRRFFGRDLIERRLSKTGSLDPDERS